MYSGSICDVKGLLVGHAQNEEARTGCTVLFAEDGFVAGVDVRGAAPGTRETDLLKPENMMPRINAIVLTGGSAYGLDACSGVMHALEERNIGYDVRIAKVPIVCGAVLFDLGVGSAKVRPDAEMGRLALENATDKPVFGHVGAGTGATVGKLITAALPQDSGVGSASITLPEGVTVGAVVAVNACGDVYHPETGAVIGCAHMSDGTPVLAEGLLYGHAPAPQQMRIPAPGSNTTIGVVAVDCKLTKEQANRLADVSHDGLARTIRPVHTQMDGDTMFALGTGRVDADVNFVKLCAAAAEVTARAIANALLFSRL